MEKPASTKSMSCVIKLADVISQCYDKQLSQLPPIVTEQLFLKEQLFSVNHTMILTKLYLGQKKASF